MPILGLIALAILGILISFIQATFRAINGKGFHPFDILEGRDGPVPQSTVVEEELDGRDEDDYAGAQQRAKRDWEEQQKASQVCSSCRIFYARLGIPVEATQAEIKQRYRDLCMVWHPDRFELNTKMKDKATKEFQEIQQAFNHINTHVSAGS